MNKKLDIKTVIEQFESVHNNNYDYSKFEYINTDYKSVIICKIHNEFKMSHYKHFRRKQGCHKCSNLKIGDRTRLNKEEIVIRFKKIHGNKYNYDKVEYINSKTNIIIICSVHGDFKQNPRTHLNGSGCKLCTGERNIKNANDLLKILNKSYVYPEIEKEFKNLNSVITVHCKKHKILYKKKISRLLGRDTYCNLCSKEKTIYSGYKLSEWLKYCDRYNIKTAFIYLLKCKSDVESFYKIGITTKTNIQERYKSKFLMPYEYEVIDVKEDNPSNIFNLEKKLLKLNKTENNRYTPLINFRGKYETFKNILIWN